MTISIMKRLEFDYGHRIIGHEGKCKHLHGHRGVAEIYVESPKLDRIGRVVDFGVIKEKVGKWIDDYWDHNLIIGMDDPLAILWTETYAKKKMVSSSLFKAVVGTFGNQTPYILKDMPTAENMAIHLFNIASALLVEYPINVTSVVMWETPASHARYSLNSQD